MTTTTPQSITKAGEYLVQDSRHTLFPLNATPFLASRFSEELAKDIASRILVKPPSEGHFPPQQRCYAAKKGFHLRRTVKLDPVSEYFLYSIVFKNRKSFRRDARKSRQSFGYRFAEGKPQSPAEAYGAFKAAIRDARGTYAFELSVDVATYFNSIYHHDLVNCVRELGWTEPDAAGLGKFLREANVGRSIDCLPHGLHPCKVLGAEFLRFVDNSHRLKAPVALRFLDDIHLFADDPNVLTTDLLVIQELLGEKGLSLNDAKTIEGLTVVSDFGDNIDVVKQDLLQLRRKLFVVSDIEVEIEVEEAEELSDEQIEYLVDLIRNPEINESDAELVLALLRDRSADVLPRMMSVLERFPALSKSIYHYAKFADDLEGLDALLLEFLSSGSPATEYQLFWIVKLAEEFLHESPKYGSILIKAFEHPGASVVSRAKVLEVPDRRFGLPDLREVALKDGAAGWEAWAAAIGTQKVRPATRNHLLSYFGNVGPINRLIADCMKSVK